MRVLLRHLAEGLVVGSAAPDGYVVDEGCGAPSPLGDISAQVWACVLPMRTAGAERSLASALERGAHGIVLLDTVGLVDLEWAGSRLAVLEAEHDRPDGSVHILATIEGPAGIMGLQSLARASSMRLAGLVFRPRALAEAVDCDRDAAAIGLAGAQVVLTAAAAGVPALLDGVSDEPALRAARRDGFAGVTLVDPALVEPARTIFGRSG